MIKTCGGETMIVIKTCGGERMLMTKTCIGERLVVSCDEGVLSSCLVKRLAMGCAVKRLVAQEVINAFITRGNKCIIRSRASAEPLARVHRGPRAAPSPSTWLRADGEGDRGHHQPAPPAPPALGAAAVLLYTPHSPPAAYSSCDGSVG